MGKELIDYSAGVPSAKAIKDAGFAGAVRYVSPARESWMAGKPIRRRETDDFKAHGLELVSVYQNLKEDWKRGRAGGVVDATDAIIHHLAAGGPQGAVIYCAIDSDPTISQYNTTAVQYILGFWDTLKVSGYRPGVYCNTKVYAWLKEDGHKDFLWWKHGWGSDATIEGAAIHQYEIDKYTVGGVKVDRNRVYAEDYGQWSKVGAPAAPAPAPATPPKVEVKKKVSAPIKPGTFKVTSGFGKRNGVDHNGTDFAAPIGTPIYAVADGFVVEGKDRTGVSGFGSWIWLDCQDSVQRDFIYGHVQHSGILVTAGDRVVAGQQIGVVGNEGQSTGPHLHFEVWGPPGRIGGAPEDPSEWLERHVTNLDPSPSTTPIPTPPKVEPVPEPPKVVIPVTTPKPAPEVPGGVTPGWRGDPTWLADVLRAEGLTVIESPGWKDRGHGDFGTIWGVLLHHTGPGSTNGLRGIVTTGVTYADGSKLDGPLCNIYLRRDGVVEVIAAGLAYHAGKGSYPGLPINDANDKLIGIEAENTGSEGWTPVQWEAYARVCAAIVRKIAQNEKRCISHKEWAGRATGKWDPGLMEMDDMRASIAGYLSGRGYLPPDPDRFPLPSGFYYGPLEGPTESVSGSFGTEAPSWKAGLQRWQRAVGVEGTGVWGPETAKVATQLQKERGWHANPNWADINGGFGGIYEGEWDAVIRHGWLPRDPDAQPEAPTESAPNIIPPKEDNSVTAPTPPPVITKQVGKIKDISGPGITNQYGINATDLGISVRMKNGEILTIFGDSFTGGKVGEGEWRSPTGLISKTTNLEGGITWDRAAGASTSQATQLLPYAHNNPEFSTVLPSDLVVLPDGTIVMHVMVNKGLGNVVWSELQVSRDNGVSWQHSGIKFGGDWNSGFRQLWTMEYNPDDGYVYSFSTGFQRNKGIIMHRIRWEEILKAGSEGRWEPWGFANNSWGWGKPATVILPGKFGELYLRRLDKGFWTLTYFNAENYRIDCMVFDSPTANLHTARSTKQKTLVSGGSWGQESDSRVAQLYCGCPIPGSTPSRWHYVVSQWNTSTGWPYKSMQFVNSIPTPAGYTPSVPQQPVVNNPITPQVASTPTPKGQ